MSTERPFQYVFGPVASRRLGRSLGVDVVPFKRCTLNCIYCQLGATLEPTLTRAEFVPLGDVVAEVARKLAAGVSPDYVTLSGSGEPTLYSRLGELIGAIKARTSVPVAVITNGTLLWDPEVRNSLIGADLIMPSLDAGDQALFDRVNRPHAALRFEQVVEGLAGFREQFSGPIWLEVFVLADTSDADVERIAALARHIRPDRVQLNTVARPPAEPFALPASEERLRGMLTLFGKNAEIIAEFSRHQRRDAASTTHEHVLAMLKRRPCSVEDIVSGLSISRSEALEHLAYLVQSQDVRPEPRGETTYYLVSNRRP